jgi:hypothetical protein
MKTFHAFCAIIKRIRLGFNKAYETPTLPDRILKIQNYPIIRILRFLGGVSFIFIATKRFLNFPIYFLYIAIFFTLFFTIYHFIISFFRIKHIIALLKSDKLDIRNSPLDRLASLASRAFFCFKGGCETAQPIGLTLGIMLGTDEVLRAADRKPIFAPILGGILNSILPANLHKDSTLLLNNNIEKLLNNKEEIKLNNSLLERFNGLNLKGDLTKEEYLEFKQIIIENKKALFENNEVIKKKIIELIDQKTKDN